MQAISMFRAIAAVFRAAVLCNTLCFMYIGAGLLCNGFLVLQSRWTGSMLASMGTTTAAQRIGVLPASSLPVTASAQHNHQPAISCFPAGNLPPWAIWLYWCNPLTYAFRAVVGPQAVPCSGTPASCCACCQHCHYSPRRCSTSSWRPGGRTCQIPATPHVLSAPACWSHTSWTMRTGGPGCMAAFLWLHEAGHAQACLRCQPLIPGARLMLCCTAGG